LERSSTLELFNSITSATALTATRNHTPALKLAGTRTGSVTVTTVTVLVDVDDWTSKLVVKVELGAGDADDGDN
jgi:hypothetical protein